MKTIVSIVVITLAVSGAIYLAMVTVLPDKHWSNGPYKCATNMNTGYTHCSANQTN